MMSSAVRDRTARTRIREYLADHGPVVDTGGRATAILKDAVEYKGSPVAFIQLLTAMDKDSEILREIRGKRTYSVTAPAGASRRMTASAAPLATASGLQFDIDYDELARALFREAVRALTAQARTDAPIDQLEIARAERDKVIAERDEYARRLEVARRQLGALIGESTAGGGFDPAIETQGRSLLAQLADEQSTTREEQAS